MEALQRHCGDAGTRAGSTGEGIERIVDGDIALEPIVRRHPGPAARR